MKDKTPYILLAEDDLDDQELIKQAVISGNPGIGIVCVQDGPELLQYLHTCDDAALPALILLDYKMPIMTASQILESLYKNPRYIPISKFVWSTSNRPEYVDNCIQWGATNYFLKPSSLAQLENIVAWILKTIHFQQSIWKKQTP